MPDVRGLLADPEFNALPMERRQAILARINPGLAQEYVSRQQAPSFPGKDASFSQGQPESAWHSAWESVRNAVFGHPDQAEAEAAGIYTQPPPSKLYAGAAEAALMAYGAPAAGAALSKLPGAVGRVGAWMATHPRTVTAAAGAVPGALRGNPKEAGAGAVAGLALGGPGKNAIDAIRRAKDLMAAGKSAEAQALIEAVRRMAPEAAPAAVAIEKAAASEAAPVASKVASKVIPEAPVVSKAADLGKEAVARHRKLVEFAKEAAQRNPKMGQKIWMELDAAGDPVRLLTPDQAGAAARKGLKTTWIKNLWGSTAGAFAE